MIRGVIIMMLALSVAHGQVPKQWIAEASKTKAAELTAYRGETLILQPTITAYGAAVTNITDYSLLWQTNGMATTWWQTNVLRWTPDMDVGASTYTLFIRAASSNGINYSANAVLRLLNSPGYTPNALALPPRSIDFATVVVTNAPWITSSALSAYYTRAETDAALSGKASTGALHSATLDLYGAIATAATSSSQHVASAISALPLPTLLVDPANSNQWVSIVGNIIHVYSVIHTNTLWSYHCGINAVTDYPGVNWAPYPQDGIFTNAPPPLGSEGEIVTPMVGNSGGTFCFWWTSGYYRLSYPNDFPQVGATWDGTTLQGDNVDVYIRWLGESAVITNYTRLVIATTNDISTHNADTNAHAFILGEMAQRPDYAALAWVADAATNYTRQYIVEVIEDAELANIPMVQLLIGDHDTNHTAHADIRASLTNLPPLPKLTLINNYSTNANSTLLITVSNGVLLSSEVIP